VDFPPVQRLFSAASQETSFPGRETKSAPWRPWVRVGDASVYILIANTVPAEADLGEDASEPTRKAPGDYAKNVVSIVSIVDFRSSQMVITGDATGLTLAQCNWVMEAADVGVDLLIDNFMVTAPHHGAARTTYDLLGVTSSTETREEVAERNLKSFVDNMQARTLTASAGLVEKFKHPSGRVLQAFWPRLGAGAWNDPLLAEERHFYTAYFTRNQYDVNTGSGTSTKWPNSDNWYTVQSSKNLFSNLYFLSPNQAPALVPPSPGQLVTPVTSGPTLPPLGANWIFRVPRALGVKRSVLQLANRTTTLAVRAQALGLRPSAAFTPAPAAFPAAAAAQAPPLTLDTPPGLVPIGPPAFALPVLGLASAPPRHAAPAPATAPAAPAGLRGLKVVP
jgi:hypothetical protein